MIKFFRGSKALYKPAVEHKDGIYFATDTHELLVNNVAYGMSAEGIEDLTNLVNEKVKNVEFTSPNVIKFTKGDGTSITVTLPEATPDSAGLMSATDKAKLNALKSQTEIDAAINAVQSNLDEETTARITKDTALENEDKRLAGLIQNNADAIENLIGGSGGSGTIDTKIQEAINGLKGDVENLDTLGKIEDALNAEITRAKAAEGVNASGISDINTLIGEKTSATITSTKIWQAIEEVESDVKSSNQDVTDAIEAVQTELTNFKNTKGQASGLASLDETGKVPSAQLPSYVDDVLEFANAAGFPESGESGKIYVAIDTNLTYRWGGTKYVEISPSIALGETSSTAFPGDRGKALEDKVNSHVADTENPHSVTKSQVGLEKVENLAPAEMPISTATQSALDLKADKTEVTKAISDLKGSATDYPTLGDLEDAIKAEVTRAKGAEGAITSKVTGLEDTVGAPAEGDSSPATGIFKIIEDNEKVTSQALTNLDTRVGYPKDGDSAASGLYKYIDDKVSEEHGDLTALEERVTTAEGKLDVIQGSESTPGSINKALADAKSYAELLLEWEEVTE
jgi:hypothetical protein